MRFRGKRARPGVVRKLPARSALVVDVPTGIVDAAKSPRLRATTFKAYCLAA